MIKGSGVTIILVIRRRRCRNCNRIHHELPDLLVPYKRHTAATFEKIYEGTNGEICCDDNSIRRMRIWLEGIFLPTAIRMLYSPILEGHQLLLTKILRSGPGWLNRLVSETVNKNLWHTHFAFLSG